MNASCVTSSTSAGSRTSRDNSRPSFRWYFEHQELVGPLVTLLRAQDELLIDLAITHPIPESSLLYPPNGRCADAPPGRKYPSPRGRFRGLDRGARFHEQTVAGEVSSVARGVIRGR